MNRLRIETFIAQGLVCAGLLLARAGLRRIARGKAWSAQGCSWQGLVSTRLLLARAGIPLQIPHKRDNFLEALLLLYYYCYYYSVNLLASHCFITSSASDFTFLVVMYCCLFLQASLKEMIGKEKVKVWLQC